MDSNLQIVKIAELEAVNEELRTKIAGLESYIERLEVRLEIDHYWENSDEGQGDDLGLVKVIIPKSERETQIDGIYCRDCTIKLQDEAIDRMEKRIKALEQELVKVGIRMIEDEQNAKD